MADMRECPVDGCTRNHPSRMAMCRAHWRKVPKDLQDRVYATARKMWADDPDLETAYTNWVEARDAAVAAVEMSEAA